MRRAWHRHSLVAASLLFAAGGCSFINQYEDPAIVGDWKGELNSDDDLRVEIAGDGRATLHFTIPPEQTGYEAKFDHEWEQSSDSEFELKMDCRATNAPNTTCSSLDFTMDCEPNSDGDELDCSGNQRWSTVPLDWKDD